MEPDAGVYQRRGGVVVKCVAFELGDTEFHPEHGRDLNSDLRRRRRAARVAAVARAQSGPGLAETEKGIDHEKGKFCRCIMRHYVCASAATPLPRLAFTRYGRSVN
ncbi:hypothetical protein EVAR_27444_1 [Eumeta japonica]|uniref:Uncharacterized protein n=1 Tax=Eumeta variegata TaxID=151549 RepID=A0A4C1VMG2_EUMVA|nr:hypothetical protein EVAR_27444_1 [Eumeta japonica]